MHLINVVLLVVLTVSSINAGKVTNARINQIITQKCPSSISAGGSRYDEDIIVENSTKVNFYSVYRVQNADTLRLRDDTGKVHTITFPGCYDVTVSFNVNQVLKNPYTETYLEMGTKLPCRTYDEYTNVGTGRALNVAVATVCSNITKLQDWCPISNNYRLRTSNDRYADDACRVCDACNTAVHEYNEEERRQGRKYVQVLNDGNRRQCEWREGDNYRATLRVCTPSKEELERNELWRDYNDRFKYGSLVFVAHILDREEIEPARMSDCQRLCSVLDTQARNFGANSRHVALLERQITQQCQPMDIYVGCTYTTISFDVLN